MPKKTVKSKKPKLINLKSQAPQDLEEFVREADEVRFLTTLKGWSIIARDLTSYRNSLIDKIAYIDPTKPEFNEAKILFIAIDKLFSIVNDYQDNRDMALDLLNKLNNPDLAVTMDIDNEGVR